MLSVYPRQSFEQKVKCILIRLCDSSIYEHMPVYQIFTMVLNLDPVIEFWVTRTGGRDRLILEVGKVRVYKRIFDSTNQGCGVPHGFFWSRRHPVKVQRVKNSNLLSSLEPGW